MFMLSHLKFKFSLFFLKWNIPYLKKLKQPSILKEPNEVLEIPVEPCLIPGGPLQLQNWIEMNLQDFQFSLYQQDRYRYCLIELLKICHVPYYFLNLHMIQDLRLSRMQVNAFVEKGFSYLGWDDYFWMGTDLGWRHQSEFFERLKQSFPAYTILKQEIISKDEAIIHSYYYFKGMNDQEQIWFNQLYAFAQAEREKINLTNSLPEAQNDLEQSCKKRASSKRI